MLMAYAQADNEVVSDEMDDPDHDHYENDYHSMLLGNNDEFQSIESGGEERKAEEAHQTRLAQAQALSVARGANNAHRVNVRIGEQQSLINPRDGNSGD